MKKFLIITALVLMGSLTSSCDIIQAVSSSYAKEYCSCRFIEEQDDKYCADYAKQIVEVKKYWIDFDKKLVWARGLGKETLVQFDQVKGCQIISK